MITARTLKFPAGSTTIITAAFNIKGTAGSPAVLMSIASSSGSSPATIQSSIHIILLDYLNITWLTFSGVAAWVLTVNSVDQGHNTGLIVVKNLIIGVVSSWKTGTLMQVSIGGVWKVVSKAQIKISGVWKSIF